MLSTEDCFTLKMRGLLQHTVDTCNEVSALARLTFYENLSIGKESSTHCPHKWVSVLCGLNLVTYRNSMRRYLVEACVAEWLTPQTPGFKPHPSHCFLRQGTSLHFV